ncbi:MAG: M56 family metallopeptidase [Planctomycetota bacterium]|jgi:beta-lactamase regulating signal transducer with metallopeptidase domain
MPPLDLLDQPAWQRETLTLLHFLWQGLAVAAVLTAVLWLFRVRRVRARYTLNLLALLAMAACPVVTFAVLETPTSNTAGAVSTPEPAPPRPAPEPETTISDARPAGEGQLHDAQATSRHRAVRGPSLAAWGAVATRFMRTHQSYLLAGWGAGVALLSVRLLLSVMGLYWVRRGRQPISAELRDCVVRLCEQLKVRLTPMVMASERIREALVVGFLRPMVLLPASWVVEMTPEVLEAVIAHELAHVRRWDLWVNAFQRVVETLLFYHPAVWWLSRRVRLEREMCCDELAVAATGRRGVYVDTLELVARKRFVPAEPALASTLGGGKMVLLNRIRYIAGFAPSRDRARWWPVGLLTLLVPFAIWLASTSVAQPESRAGEEQPPRVAPDERAAAPGELLLTFRKPTPAPDKCFGASLAVVNNNVVVAAFHSAIYHSDDDRAGAAYLFDGSTGELLQTFRNPRPPSSNEWFGSLVAGVGNNVLITDAFADVGPTGSGAVYLFDAATGKVLRTFLNPSPDHDDGFGYSIAVLGNNVVVGAPFDDTGAENAGAVYLFNTSSGKLLRTFQKPTPARTDVLGWSVAVAGNKVLAGAPGDDTGEKNAGVAYLFDGATGELMQTFLNPTPKEGDAFGYSVAVLGDNALVAACTYDTGAKRPGAVYLFESSTGKLLQTFQRPTRVPDDAFGYSVAGVGNNVLVGAHFAFTTDTGHAGAAYLFDPSTGKLLRTFRNPTPVAHEGHRRNDYFGISVAALGNDLLIGAHGTKVDCRGTDDAGAVYLFKGLGESVARGGE